MSIRVVLADSQELIRQSLRALLEHYGFEVVGEAGDGREAVRLTRELNPDIVIAELSLPVLNGLDAARQITRLSPRAKTILLTLRSDEREIGEALRAGVRGYVLKTQTAQDLVKAIEEVSREGVYLGPRIARSVVNKYLGTGKLPADPLTPREREILQLIAEGKRAKEIGSILGISSKTVESHRGKIMDKLNIRDTAGLVRYAIRRGLVEP